MTATLSFAPRAIIIGGSTAGLLIGALLRRRGWHIDVFERSPVELAGRGAGIVCHPELFHALDESGAGTDAIGIDVAERIAFDDNGSIIGRLAFPQTVTSWDRLYQLVRKVVPDSHYHLDHALLGVEQDAEGVRATFTNGRQVAGELLIGADGFRQPCASSSFRQSRPNTQLHDMARSGRGGRAASRHQNLRTVCVSLPGGCRDFRISDRRRGRDFALASAATMGVWYRKTSEVELKDMLTDDSAYHHPMGIAPTLIRGTSSP